MKDNLSEKRDEALRDLFSNIEELPEYNLKLEDRIMHGINLEQDHSAVIRKYKRWSRIGFIISIGLVLLLFGISFLNVADTSRLDSDKVNLEHYIPSLFAFIGLVLLFVQMEVRKHITIQVDYTKQ